mmetsp:Transcript_7859/g.13176  ORF Transcript_7859/g.13176 Transcript_7859/m.13176 type:complete len:464 (-) Transcript_7859:149-1540(-)
MFEMDSTFLLVKKFLVYKLMGSNLFLNYSLGAVSVAYRLMGIRLTNFLINHSVGSIFTSGESVQSLVRDRNEHDAKNIGSIGCYFVEGLKTMDLPKMEKFYSDILESIEVLSNGQEESNLALRLTTLIPLDVQQKLNRAQQVFVNDILKFSRQDTIDISDLKNSLLERGIAFSPAELSLLFQSLQFEDNKGGETVSRLEIYANGHLFRITPPQSEDQKVLEFLRQRIALGTGTGVSEEDLLVFEDFAAKVLHLTTVASERNCSLFVDAEQSYIQDSIASVAQQLTHIFNRGEKHTIMNGYQCYLKKTPEIIQYEVATSKRLGYNLGIKLIRGAYMNEERKLAQENGYESPVWEEIEETHKSYNDSMVHIIRNLTPEGLLLVASHNTETVALAKQEINEQAIADDRVRFAQLKAFSDHVTGQLSFENFKVYKYLPYGPMEEVMPYLIRRGQESKQVCREQVYQN